MPEEQVIIEPDMWVNIERVTRFLDLPEGEDVRRRLESVLAHLGSRPRKDRPLHRSQRTKESPWEYYAYDVRELRQEILQKYEGTE